MERRERFEQRHAVERLLPGEGEGSVLRMPTGPVLIYDDASKRDRVELRAAVMPDGATIEFTTRRFARDS